MESLQEDLLERVRVRIGDEPAEDTVLNEYIRTALDRICLRLGEASLPALFSSVAVDVAVKMHRRSYHEGLSSESVNAAISANFVEDILNEYTAEFEAFKKYRASGEGGSLRVVRFL